jgi:hypothetical protein
VKVKPPLPKLGSRSPSAAKLEELKPPIPHKSTAMVLARI